MATKPANTKMQTEQPKKAAPAPAAGAKTTAAAPKKKGGVPENILRKEKRDAKTKEELTTRRATLKKTRTEKKAEYLKRGEKYFKDAADKSKSIITERRKARAAGAYFVADEPKVYLVVRIRGINNLSPVVRKILQLLRLRQLHNATFVRVSKATTNMLRKVEPFITYGYPSSKLISQLIYKRGFAKVNGQRIPLNSNEIVENSLGKQGLISIEDLVHEITSCGPHFKQANNFLWPFKLTSPRKGYSAKRHPYHSSGDWGNRETEINELVQRML